MAVLDLYDFHNKMDLDVETFYEVERLVRMEIRKGCKNIIMQNIGFTSSGKDTLWNSVHGNLNKILGIVQKIFKN